MIATIVIAVLLNLGLFMPLAVSLTCDNLTCVDPKDGVIFMTTYRLNMSYDFHAVFNGNFID
jgi:hypothetical protein